MLSVESVDSKEFALTEVHLIGVELQELAAAYPQLDVDRVYRSFVATRARVRLDGPPRSTQDLLLAEYTSKTSFSALLHSGLSLEEAIYRQKLFKGVSKPVGVCVLNEDQLWQQLDLSESWIFASPEQDIDRRTIARTNEADYAANAYLAHQVTVQTLESGFGLTRLDQSAESNRLKIDYRALRIGFSELAKAKNLDDVFGHLRYGRRRRNQYYHVMAEWALRVTEKLQRGSRRPSDYVPFVPAVSSADQPFKLDFLPFGAKSLYSNLANIPSLLHSGQDYPVSVMTERVQDYFAAAKVVYKAYLAKALGLDSGRPLAQLFAEAEQKCPTEAAKILTINLQLDETAEQLKILLNNYHRHPDLINRR